MRDGEEFLPKDRIFGALNEVWQCLFFKHSRLSTDLSLKVYKLVRTHLQHSKHMPVGSRCLSVFFLVLSSRPSLSVRESTRVEKNYGSSSHVVFGATTRQGTRNAPLRAAFDDGQPLRRSKFIAAVKYPRKWRKASIEVPGTMPIHQVRQANMALEAPQTVSGPCTQPNTPPLCPSQKTLLLQLSWLWKGFLDASRWDTVIATVYRCAICYTCKYARMLIRIVVCMQ